ncbi:hypothetical protein C8A00DRAFT_46188 [Chaetomidium leptoderma]|uniref:Uncharacterized protein n=1 Tax=Chaetomidium leptoderma TaxID=669021 RepID=A0AAN6VFM3_9PEZI|nr:hypothetical protein C8A00DRAFT_46188 [Chaetomidium leptoderma]
MVQASTWLVALGCLLSSWSFFVSGSPLVPTERGVGLYTFADGPIQWRGALEEGQEPVYLTGGTFEEIEAKAKALNPTYTIFDNSSVALKARDGLNTRQTQAIHCGWPPGWTASWDSAAITVGIAYLRGISGDCRGAPGPGACGRVSCSWSSAIYYCNDNTYEIWEPCRWIGDVAASIVDSCEYLDQVPLRGRTIGQAFDYRKWNTIVAAGDC